MLEPSRVRGELSAWPGSIPIENLYTAGIAGEKFLRALQKEAKLLGSRCNGCGKTYLPARLFCESCFLELAETVEVPNRGKIDSFTTVHVDLDGERLEKPVTVGLVRFNGIEGGLIHKISGVAPEKLSVGMAVKAIFEDAPGRSGSILDIRHFVPA